MIGLSYLKERTTILLQFLSEVQGKAIAHLCSADSNLTYSLVFFREKKVILLEGTEAFLYNKF